MTNAVQTSSSSTATRPAAPLEQQQQQRHVVPPVDVFENEASITLLADLPGVPREQLHVRVDGDNLVLEATATAAGATTERAGKGSRARRARQAPVAEEGARMHEPQAVARRQQQ